MLRPLRLALAAAAVLALGPTSAPAVTIWDEGSNGDLSNNRLAPTGLGTLGLGTSSVVVTSVVGDREYFTLTIAAGHRLDAIVLGSFASVSVLSFVGIQSGSTFTEPPTGTNVTNLLGWTHFGPGLVGTDLLDDIGLGAGAIGFTPPLPAGSYTFWSQETGADPATYRFDFQVSEVPEPGTALLLGLGVLGLARRTPRRP